MCKTRNSSLLGKITVLFVICCCSLPAQAKYGGGTGEPNDPYLIFTAEQMNQIGLSGNWDDWDKHFKLMADIDLAGFTGTSFNIIGYFVNWSDYKPFTGVFDGNGHTISNFTYTSTETNDIGLFGYVDDPNAEIKNLGLIDPNVDAGTGDDVGSLVGRLGYDGTINGCYVESGSVAGDEDVGGLVGYNGATITNCYSTGSVSGNESVGGLVGINGHPATITNCYSTGTVMGGGSVGGLVGHNGHWGTITNCYSTGSVSGDNDVGGLVGGNRGTITNCYSEASVLGHRDVGGLVGKNDGGTITNCYSTGSVTGTSDVGGLVGDNSGHVINSYWNVDSGSPDNGIGIPKTTDEMMMASTFLNWGACVGIWTIEEGVDYPRLAWEMKPGEPVVDILPLEGDGDSKNPYLIYTAEELNLIGQIPCVWDKHFKLMADIDLSGYTGTSFNIIGIDWRNAFTGVFDGNGHTISNFTYTSTGTNYIALFGHVDDPNAEIKDLGLIDPNVDAGIESWAVGSLVGWLRDGTITGCYVEGGSVSGDDGVGGLVGDNRGTITNCYSTGSVEGYEYVGGLVGSNYKGTITNCDSVGDVSGYGCVGGLAGINYGEITNCYSTGDVLGDDEVGGLVGRNYRGTITNCYVRGGSVAGDDCVGGLVGINYGTITNCYSTGSVSGGSSVGGLVGQNGACYWPTLCSPGTIYNCYSTGSVLGTQRVGGLLGYNYQGQVRHSFWDIDTSGQDWSDGGTGLPTDQMQMQITFTDAGWDFVGETDNGIEDIWFIPQQDYPHLWWEGMQVPMKLTPVSLNCRSQGNWVKAHLTLPQGFTIADVDADTPAVLHSFGFESAPLYVFVNKNERVQIEAAFEREVVCSLAGDWPQALTVAGFLTDGTIFLGTSPVRIIHPGMKVIEELASYWLQGDCVHPTWCDGIDMNRDSLVNLADYALLMNINVEFVTDE